MLGQEYRRKNKLAVASNVTLIVYDILENEVATVLNKEFEVGFYKYQWDAGELASGIYLYRINSGNFTVTKKMLLLK